MKKLIAVFAILLIGTILGAVAFSSSYLMKSAQITTKESNAIQPTSNSTAAPQPTLTPAPTATVIPEPSTLKVISPVNTTYSTNTIELTYTINSKVLWSYYSIDASDYVDIQHLLHDNGLIAFKGNITLNLSEGPHRLKIAVQTEESRGSSVPVAYQTIDFNIDTASTGSSSSKG